MSAITFDIRGDDQDQMKVAENPEAKSLTQERRKEDESLQVKSDQAARPKLCSSFLHLGGVFYMLQRLILFI